MNGHDPIQSTAEWAALYVAGALSPQERESVEARVRAGDADLRRELAALRRTDEALTDLVPEGQPDTTGREAILQRVRADAEGPLARISPHPRGAQSRWAWTAWVAAAAALVLAVVGWWPRLVPPPAPAARSDRLASAAPDVQRADWTALEDQSVKHPDGSKAGGRVVWSTARQEGYIHLKGLAANDPTVGQYQLWIFTSDPMEAYPIDGGVFDVPAGAAETVIPVSPKLRVKKAVAFAVTREPPGGVVVTDRTRLALLATLPAPARP